MSELLKNIDARTRLAGTNKLEILLFTLGVDARSGCRETYGINVFKVREVMRRPTITAAPARSGTYIPSGSSRRPISSACSFGRPVNSVRPSASIIVKSL